MLSLKKKSVYTAMLLGWLLPGAGHYYLGYRWKAILLFTFLFAGYIAGMKMADFQNISFHKPFYLVGCSFIGGFTLVALGITSYLAPIPILYPYSYQLGCLFTTVASLLNALILLQLYSLITQAKKENSC